MDNSYYVRNDDNDLEDDGDKYDDGYNDHVVTIIKVMMMMMMTTFTSWHLC